MRRGGGSGGICGRWLFVVLCGWLMAAVCEGQGHFRFASIYWERNETETGHVVTYTIRSSWQRNYPAFEVSDLSQKDSFFAKAQKAGDEMRRGIA